MPGHHDAAGAGVLEGVEQKVLGDAPDLDDIAVDRQRVGSVGGERQAFVLGQRTELAGKPAQFGGGIEGTDAPLLLPGLQAGGRAT